jgi:hypothetical protein
VCYLKKACAFSADINRHQSIDNRLSSDNDDEYLALYFVAFTTVSILQFKRDGLLPLTSAVFIIAKTFWLNMSALKKYFNCLCYPFGDKPSEVFTSTYIFVDFFSFNINRQIYVCQFMLKGKKSTNCIDVFNNLA